MGIGPVEMNGIISRTQDIGTLKQHEDAKPLVDQQNYQAQFKNELNQNMRHVRHADDSDNNKKKFDAKEKGSNEYRNNKKDKNSKKNQEASAGNKNGAEKLHSIDISI